MRQRKIPVVERKKAKDDLGMNYRLGHDLGNHFWSLACLKVRGNPGIP